LKIQNKIIWKFGFVEIPKGSPQKFEFDEKEGQIKLDRTLYGPMHFLLSMDLSKEREGKMEIL